jgi:hypothetical protein
MLAVGISFVDDGDFGSVGVRAEGLERPTLRFRKDIEYLSTA